MYALLLNRRGQHTYSCEYSVGLFYFANRLNQLNLPFRFCSSPFDVGESETVCLSNLLNDHTSILNMKAARVIVGGIGAQASTITAAPSVLQVSGASTNIHRDLIKYGVGKTIIDPIPTHIEMPLIPQELKNHIKIIQLNCGYGCFYGKCLFCNRVPPKVVNPQLVALNICEIFKKYGYSVQLSIDGPDWNYLQKIATELISLQPTYGKAKWACNIRASDASDYSNMEFLVKSGLYSVGIGVEYLCDEILSAIKKGITVDNVFKALEYSIEFGLYLHFCIIDFAPFIIKRHRETHHRHLYNILSRKYTKLSFSVSSLVSNPYLDTALNKLKYNQGE